MPLSAVVPAASTASNHLIGSNQSSVQEEVEGRGRKERKGRESFEPRGSGGELGLVEHDVNDEPGRGAVLRRWQAERGGVDSEALHLGQGHLVLASSPSKPLLPFCVEILRSGRQGGCESAEATETEI